MKAASRKTERLLAEVIGHEQFGPDADIAVALIRPTESILNAHSRLTEALRPLGWAAKEPHYNGERFRPHIAATDDRHLRLGEQFLLNQIAVVEMIDLPTGFPTPQQRDDLRRPHANPLDVPTQHSVGALGRWGRSRLICPAVRYRDALRFLRNWPGLFRIDRGAN